MNGQARVYFPENLPQFVLKTAHSDRQINIEKAQEIIARNGFQHLVVPKVYQFYHGFLVEQRLPINDSPFHQMEIYLKHRDEFSEAIAELTEFFCQANLPDLSEGGRHALAHIAYGKPRYDNLPLYISNDRYLVGLIDLESLNPDTPIEKIPPENIYDRLKDLVRFFPYHLDQILAVARRHCKEIERDRFLAIQQNGLKLLNVAFEGYLNFLKAKGITCENPDQPLHLSEERKGLLVELMSKKLDEWFDEEAWNEKFDSIKNPSERAAAVESTVFMRVRRTERFEEKLQMVKSVLPQVLDVILAYIKKEPPKEKLTTDADLLAYRGIIGHRKRLLAQVAEILFNSLLPGNFPRKELIEAGSALGIGDCWDTHDTLVEEVFKELAKGGEIYYFDPCQTSGGHRSTLLLS